MSAFEAVQQWPTLPFKFYQHEPNHSINTASHWHPEIELNFLIAGDPLTFTTNGQAQTYHPGDCWATDRRAIHSDTGDDNQVWDEFGFIIAEPFLQAKLPSAENWHLTLDGARSRAQDPNAYEQLFAHAVAIRGLIEAGVDEYRRLAILSHFYALLVLLGQNFAITRAPGNTSANPHLVDAVMQHIQADYAHDLRGKELAKAAHVSLTTLNQQFQENLQMSVSGYVRLVRLLAARRLLLETTHTVDYIAVACGFGSTKTLQRNFLAWTHETPGAYRIRHAN